MRFSSSRRLWLSALALGCIAGAILVVALILNAQTASQPSNPTVSAAQAEATISATIANLLDVPLYPDAQDVKGNPLNDSVDLFAHTSFTVTASRDDVLTFYEKTCLPGVGLRMIGHWVMSRLRILDTSDGLIAAEQAPMLSPWLSTRLRVMLARRFSI